MAKHIKTLVDEAHRIPSEETISTGYAMLDNAGYDFPLGKLTLVVSKMDHPLHTVLLNVGLRRFARYDRSTCFFTLALDRTLDIADKMITQLTNHSLEFVKIEPGDTTQMLIMEYNTICNRLEDKVLRY